MYYKKVFESLEDTIYLIKYKLKRIYRILKWIPFLYENNYDDYGSLISIMVFKLSELKESLQKDNTYIRDKKYIKKLSVIIELLKRYDDSFIMYHHERSDKLFGDMIFVPLEGRKEKLYELKRSTYKDEKLSNRERLYVKQMNKYDKSYDKEKEELLFKLLSKHLKKYWL